MLIYVYMRVIDSIVIKVSIIISSISMIIRIICVIRVPSIAGHGSLCPRCNFPALLNSYQTTGARTVNAFEEHAQKPVSSCFVAE